MSIYVVAYCGYDDFDSPILLVTPDREHAREFARKAFYCGGDICTSIAIEQWDTEGNYYGIVEYD